LCAFLFLERWQTRPEPEAARGKILPWLVTLVALLVLLPSRVIQEANTTWRVTSWAMGFSLVAISGSGIFLAGGRNWLRHFAFPILFFLVAIPWPGGLEHLVVQKLTGWNATTTVELVSLRGIAAVQQGNAIEVSTGPVGIDEACSGIRSLQATLMIALFLGEFYRFKITRRLALVGAAVGLSFVFNVGRTFLLVAVAAKQGQVAMEKWHDPAGVTILVGCFTALWALAHWWSAPPTKFTKPTLRATKLPGIFLVSIAAVAVVAEAGTELWYRAHESATPRAGANWSVRWPRDATSFAEDKISKDVRELMNFDEGQATRWLDGEGHAWRGYFFRWLPAHSLEQRVKIQAAKGHRPDICLRALGLTLKDDFGVRQITAGKWVFPFHSFRFESQGASLYVFYSAWEDGVDANAPINLREDSTARVQAALAGARGVGQRMLEFIVSGVANEAEATALLQRQIGSLVQADGK
jgi:exosortase